MSAARPGRPLRIGLTGGIASGKTAAADAFAALGVPVIDTDQIARDVVEPGQPGLDEIVAAFGADVLTSAGRLDRARLRERVFASPDDRRRLEAMLHPRILAELERRSDAAGGPYQVLAIPLLVESSRERYVDRILVVDCPRELQKARLLTRDGGSEAQAEAILNAQATREQRLAVADDVLPNEGSLADLQAAVATLDQRYRALTGALPKA